MIEDETKSEQNLTKTYTPDELDRQLARLLIESPGITDHEIATRFGLTRATANRRRRAEKVQRLVSEAIAIPAQEIRRLMLKGLSRLEYLIDNPDPRISLLASAQIVKLGSKAIENSFLIENQVSNQNQRIVYTACWGNDPEISEPNTIVYRTDMDAAIE